MEGATVTITVVGMNALTWAAYLAVALLGGLASSMVNNKGTIIRIGWGDQDKTHIRMGPITDIVAGWAAALGILWAMSPQTLFQLIGMGAIAGYGGSAVLQALLNRLLADVSEKEKDKLELEKNATDIERKKLESERAEIVEKEKKLDKDKALINIMQKIAEAKKKQQK